MTSSSDAVTSELSDVNSSVNATEAVIPGSLVGRMPSAMPIIARVTILLILQYSACAATGSR